jgi:hypothetical protein
MADSIQQWTAFLRGGYDLLAGGSYEVPPDVEEELVEAYRRGASRAYKLSIKRGTAEWLAMRGSCLVERTPFWRPSAGQYIEQYLRRFQWFRHREVALGVVRGYSPIEYNVLEWSGTRGNALCPPWDAKEVYLQLDGSNPIHRVRLEGNKAQYEFSLVGEPGEEKVVWWNKLTNIKVGELVFQSKPGVLRPTEKLQVLRPS